MDQKSLSYEDMIDRNNPGFEPKGKGWQYYVGFETKNIFLILTAATLKNW